MLLELRFRQQRPARSLVHFPKLPQPAHAAHPRRFVDIRRGWRRGGGALRNSQRGQTDQASDNGSGTAATTHQPSKQILPPSPRDSQTERKCSGRPLKEEKKQPTGGRGTRTNVTEPSSARPSNSASTPAIKTDHNIVFSAEPSRRHCVFHANMASSAAADDVGGLRRLGREEQIERERRGTREGEKRTNTTRRSDMLLEPKQKCK